MNQPQPLDISQVTRVSVIGPGGVRFEDYDLYPTGSGGAQLLLQDEGRTLKILPAQPTVRRPRILITGSRHYNSYDTVHDAIIRAIAEHGNLDAPHLSTIVHGGASGADEIAGRVARFLGASVEVHPAQWAALGKKAGPIRNQEMVDAGADVCLAFPLGESRGTRGCMRAASAAGIPLVVAES